MKKIDNPKGPGGTCPECGEAGHPPFKTRDDPDEEAWCYECRSCGTEWFDLFRVVCETTPFRREIEEYEEQR